MYTERFSYIHIFVYFSHSCIGQKLCVCVSVCVFVSVCLSPCGEGAVSGRSGARIVYMHIGECVRACVRVCTYGCVSVWGFRVSVCVSACVHG